MVAAHAHAAVRVLLQLQFIQIQFMFLNHRDVALDSIEIAIHNVFQMLLAIHCLLIAHQAFQLMDLEIVFLQLAQYHVHLDLHQEVEAVFQLIVEILQQP